MHPVEVAGSVSDPGAMESSFLKLFFRPVISILLQKEQPFGSFGGWHDLRTGFTGFPVQMFSGRTCKTA
jgi:hypothetical protein